MDNRLILYHGSDHKLPKPLFGFGKKDNDYGSGFYTTADREKAAEWAASNGSDGAYINTYEIDTKGLNIVNFDEYGALTWIVELVKNRGTRGEDAILLGKKLVEKYKIDLSQADIVIGYRAGECYSDIIDAFLNNQINIDEAYQLFNKEKLGRQYCIKSKRAFDRLKYIGFQLLEEKDSDYTPEIEARMEAVKFLHQRDNQIYLNGFHPSGVTAKKAAENYYEYNTEYQYYNIADIERIEETEYEIDIDEEEIR